MRAVMLAAEGPMLALSMGAMAVTVGLMIFSIYSARKPQRIRVGREVARLLIGLAGTLAVGAVTNIESLPALLVGAALVGLLIGWVRGQATDVAADPEGTLYARSTMVALVFLTFGLVAMQVAAIVNRAEMLQLGQAGSFLAAGIGFGVIMGRGPKMKVVSAGAAAGAGAAFAMLLVLVVATATGPAADAQSTANGVWVRGPVSVGAGQPVDNYDPQIGGTGGTVFVTFQTSGGGDIGEVGFDVSWGQPDAQLDPRETGSISYDISVGAMPDNYDGDALIGLGYYAFLDRIDLRPEGVSTSIGCSFGQGCTARPPDSGGAEFTMPAVANDGDERTLIIGFLNCGPACTAEWTYTFRADTSSPSNDPGAVPPGNPSGTGSTTSSSTSSSTSTSTSTSSTTTTSEPVIDDPSDDEIATPPVNTQTTPLVNRGGTAPSREISEEEALQGTIAALLTAVAVGLLSAARANEAIDALLLDAAGRGVAGPAPFPGYVPTTVEGGVRTSDRARRGSADTVESDFDGDGEYDMWGGRQDLDGDGIDEHVMGTGPAPSAGTLPPDLDAAPAGGVAGDGAFEPLEHDQDQSPSEDGEPERLDDPMGETPDPGDEEGTFEPLDEEAPPPPQDPNELAVSDEEIEDIYRRGLANGRSLDDLRQDVAGLSGARGGSTEVGNPLGLAPSDTDAGPVPLTAAERGQYAAAKEQLDRLKAQRRQLDQQWAELQQERAKWAAHELKAEMRQMGAAYEVWELAADYDRQIAAEQAWVDVHRQWSHGNRWVQAPDGTTYHAGFESKQQSAQLMHQRQERITALRSERTAALLDRKGSSTSTDNLARLDREQDRLLDQRRSLDQQMDAADATRATFESYGQGRPLP